MIEQEPPAATPEQPAQTREAEPREEDTPIGVADAWARLMQAVARVPEDDVTRAISAVARATIRAETARTEQPPITDQVLLAFSYMQRLGDVLAMIERNKAASTAAVMDALFAGHPRAPASRPNGAFGP